MTFLSMGRRILARLTRQSIAAAAFAMTAACLMVQNAGCSGGTDNADSGNGPAADRCVSPAQNLETAYDAGAVGCACRSGVDRSVCVTDKNGRNVALVCENDRWTAVEDGPCAPGPR